MLCVWRKEIYLYCMDETVGIEGRRVKLFCLKCKLWMEGFVCLLRECNYHFPTYIYEFVSHPSSLDPSYHRSVSLRQPSRSLLLLLPLDLFVKRIYSFFLSISFLGTHTSQITQFHQQQYTKRKNERWQNILCLFCKLKVPFAWTESVFFPSAPAFPGYFSVFAEWKLFSIRFSP